jgi:hypothetical protein
VSDTRYFTRSDEGYWEEVALLEIDPKEIFLDLVIQETNDQSTTSDSDNEKRAILTTLAIRRREAGPTEIDPTYGPSIPIQTLCYLIDGNHTCRRLTKRHSGQLHTYVLDITYDQEPPRNVKLIPPTDEEGCILTQTSEDDNQLLRDYDALRPTLLDAETAEEINWLSLRLRWTIGGLTGTIDILDPARLRPQPNEPVHLLRQKIRVV